MAQIDVIFPNKFGIPGQQLNCIIYLNVQKPFSHGRLICTLQGKEKTGLRISVTKSRYNKRTRKHVQYTVQKNIKDKKDIYHNEQAIIEGPVAPGSYQYPYSFVVPYNVPSSFEFEKDENNYAKIKYEAKVRFEGFIGTENFVVKDVDSVYIIQVYPSDYRVKNEEKIFMLKTCNCCERGKILLKAQFEKTIYHPGEKARFLVHADAGDSEVSPKDVIGDCYREITVKCLKRSKVFTKLIDKTSVGKIEKGTASGDLVMTPTIDVPLEQMTTIGNLVKAKFFLRARVCMEMTLQEDPCFSLPILVCGLPEPEKRANFVKQFVAPPGWQNPVQMDPVVANLKTHADTYPNYYQNSVQGNQGNINPMLMNAPQEAMALKEMPQNAGNEEKKNENGKSFNLLGALSQGVMTKPIHPMEMYNQNFAHAPGDPGIKNDKNGPLGDKERAEHVLLEEKKKDQQRFQRLVQKRMKKEELKKQKKNNNIEEEGKKVHGEGEGIIQEPVIKEKSQNETAVVNGGNEGISSDSDSDENDSSYSDSSSDQVRAEKKKAVKAKGGNTQAGQGGEKEKNEQEVELEVQE